MSGNQKSMQRDAAGKLSPAITRSTNSSNKQPGHQKRTVNPVPVPVLIKEREDLRQKNQELHKENEDLKHIIEQLRKDFEDFKKTVRHPEKRQKPQTSGQDLSLDESDGESVDSSEAEFESEITRKNKNKKNRVQKKQANVQTVKEKVPPIVVFSSDLGNVTRELENETSEFQIQVKNKQKFQVRAKNKEAREKVIKKLKELSVEYHTYADKSETFKRFVLKGLSGEVDVDKLKDQIEHENQGFQIKFIKPLIVRGRKTENYVVFVGQEVSNSEVHEIRTIGKVIVKWEGFRSNEIARCRNCKRYGHIAKRCGRNYRCSKCLENHGHGQCKMEKDVPKSELKCVNCKKQGHPATYNGCEVHIRLMARRRNKQQDAFNHPTYAAVTTSTGHRQRATREEPLGKRLKELGKQVEQQQQIIIKLLEHLNVQSLQH